MSNSSTIGFITSLAGVRVSGWNAAAGTMNPNGSNGTAVAVDKWMSEDPQPADIMGLTGYQELKQADRHQWS